MAPAAQPSPPPQPQGGAPQAQPPPPPPPKYCYSLVFGRGAEHENREKYDFLLTVVKWMFKENASKISRISASYDAFGLAFRVTLESGESILIPKEELTPELIQAAKHLTDLTGHTSAPTFAESGSAAPPQEAEASNQPPRTEQPAAAPQGDRASDQQPTTEPPAAALQGSAVQQRLEDLRREVAGLTNALYLPPHAPMMGMHPPMMGGAYYGAVIPQGMGMGAAPVANDPQLQRLLVDDLRSKVPRLRRISEQVQGAQKNNLDFQINQIEHPPQPLTLQQLQTCQTAILQIVFDHLQGQIQAMPEHLKQRLRIQLLPTLQSNQNALLTNLLPPLPGGLPPWRSDLGDLLAVENAIEQDLKGFVEAEIARIRPSLHPLQLQEAFDRDVALAKQNAPTLNLQSLTALDTMITEIYRNLLKIKVQTLKNGSADLHPPFVFLPAQQLPNSPHVPVPAIAGQTREHLLLMPLRIFVQFKAYIKSQIALKEIPEFAQIEPLQEGTLTPLTLLLQLPEKIIAEFTRHLDTHFKNLPKQIKTQIQGMPSRTLPELIVKHKRIQMLLTADLRTQVATENRVAGAELTTKRREQRATMLTKIGAPPGAGAPHADLAALLNELPAAAPAAAYPSLERLHAIRAPLENFLEQQRHWVARHPIYTMVALGAILLAGYYYLINPSDDSQFDRPEAWPGISLL